jgi:hypothetical protein
MSAKSGSEAVPSSQAVASVRRGLVGACVALLIAIVGLLLIKGGEIRESLEADNARAVVEEDRSFCTRFGMAPGAARYTECAAALADIRSRHDQRKADFFY